MPSERLLTALGEDLARASVDAISALPSELRAPALQATALILTGARKPGGGLPGLSDGASRAAALRARRAIDSACDRVRVAHLHAGMAVRVRCWPDNVERAGRIEGIEPGRVCAAHARASVPISVHVDYPSGYRAPDGSEPTNPASYPLERIVEPRSPYESVEPARAAPATPLRRVEHRLGARGKGWLLPDGGIVTWTVDGRGEPSHEPRYRLLGLPVRWLPRFADQRIGRDAHPGAAFAFAIKPKVGFTAASGRRLARSRQDQISAQIVLAAAESKYLRCGWTFTGGSLGETGDSRPARLTAAQFRIGVSRLLARGQLRRRHSPAPQFELPATVRRALIEAHDLDSAWAEASREPGYETNPSHPCVGQIARTRREAREEEAGRRILDVLVHYPGECAGNERAEVMTVELALEPGDGRFLWLVVRWGPSRPARERRRQQQPLREDRRRIETRLAPDTDGNVRVALLGEVARLIGAQRLLYEHGEACNELGAVLDRLPVLNTSWLSGASPQPTPAG